jgi:hypothetical protein
MNGGERGVKGGLYWCSPERQQCAVCLRMVPAQQSGKRSNTCTAHRDNASAPRDGASAPAMFPAQQTGRRAQEKCAVHPRWCQRTAMVRAPGRRKCCAALSQPLLHPFARTRNPPKWRARTFAQLAHPHRNHAHSQKRGVRHTAHAHIKVDSRATVQCRAGDWLHEHAKFNSLPFGTQTCARQTKRTHLVAASCSTRCCVAEAWHARISTHC